MRHETSYENKCNCVILHMSVRYQIGFVEVSLCNRLYKWRMGR